MSGIIVRAADWAKPLTGIPLQADITDARGIVVESRKLRLSAAGLRGTPIRDAESAPTGGWNVNLYIVKDGKADAQIGSVAVQVKEFMPDRMKAEARLSQSVVDGWVKPDGLKALFTLQNLFGTPAQNRRVEATLTLHPYFPSFRAYPDYQFFDPQHAKEGYTEPLGDRTTDDKGEADFRSICRNTEPRVSAAVSSARVTKPRADAMSPPRRMRWCRLRDYLIGCKAIDDLEFVTRDAKRTVHLVAIDPETKKIAVDGLKAAIDRAAFCLGADQAGFRRLQIRIAAQGNSRVRETACDPSGRHRFRLADEHAGQLSHS